MTKLIYLFCWLLAAICPGDFVCATEPPSYLLFHHEAQQRLDSLESQPTSENALERLILLHNLIFNKVPGLNNRVESLLDEYFSKSTEPVIMAYLGALRMMKARDRGLAGNLLKMGFTFGGLFGDTPYEEGHKGYNAIRQAISHDSTNISLRFLSLTAAVESAEHLDGLLRFAYADLFWLQDRVSQLDSAELFFYGLSWAKYAYKYALTHEIPEEAKKGQDWLTYAEQFAVNKGYCNEVYIWRLKINNLERD